MVYDISIPIYKNLSFSFIFKKLEKLKNPKERFLCLSQFWYSANEANKF